MTRPQEVSFREAAAELDTLLAAASDGLVREGLSVVDESARTYLAAVVVREVSWGRETLGRCT